MIVKETDFQLRDGRRALLRSPGEEHAEQMLSFLVQASGETVYLMRYPEEWADYTLEQERTLLRSVGENPNMTMIACFVDGKIAGSCQLAFRTGLKDRHRARVAIAILRDYWGLGIGTRMFEEMIRLARERGGVRQLELDFIEGNNRARGLYEKMGFRITGVIPDAIRLKDGRFLNEYSMLLYL